MKISAFLGNFIQSSKFTGLSLEEVAKICVSHGLTGIEVTMDQAVGGGVDDALKILFDNGLSVCGFPAFSDFIHNPSKAYAEDVISVAAKLRAKSIMAVPGFYTEDDNKEKARETSLEPIEYLCKLGEKENIFIGVESFDDFNSPVLGEKAVSWYLDKIPQLHCIFDTGNYVYIGDDTLTAYKNQKERITHHLHCHDVALKPQSTESGRLRWDGSRDFPSAVGNGVLPIGEIISDISSSGFDGIYTIENFGSQNPLEDLISSTEYIKSHIIK